jgi:hypothetical protein
MTRIPLPPDFLKSPCDPCVELRVKVKLFRRLLAAMVSEAGGEKYIALGEESDDDQVDIVQSEKSGSWKLTTV